MLLRHNADPKTVSNDPPLEPLLSLSLYQDDLKLIKLLIKYGANVNALNAKGQSPLHHCIIKSRVKQAKTLLAAGADPDFQDTKGRTPLLHALDRWDLKMADLLMPCSDLTISGYDGLTPLHCIIEAGADTSVVHTLSRLIEAGADVNARTENEGETPLELAVIYVGAEGPDVLETLVDAGCDLTAKTSEGESILHAVAWNHCSITPNIATQMMLKLINAGLDVDVVSPSQRTPTNGRS